MEVSNRGQWLIVDCVAALMFDTPTPPTTRSLEWIDDQPSIQSFLAKYWNDLTGEFHTPGSLREEPPWSAIFNLDA